MIHMHNNKMNDPIDSNRYYVQHYHDVPTYVFVGNENNQCIDNFLLNKSNSLVLHCKQYKVVVDHLHDELIEVMYKYDQLNEDNLFLVQQQMDQLNFHAISCPACVGQHRSMLQQKDLQILLDHDAFQLYLRKTLEHSEIARKLKKCNSPGCLGQVEVDADYRESWFPCPVCKNEWCRECGKSRHDDRDCKAAAAGNAVEAEANLGKTGFKRCPTC